MPNSPEGIERRKMADDIAEIKKMLLGNGKVGVVEMSRRAFEYMIACKSTKNGWMDWAFRIAIGIAISYIAVELHLK